MTNLFGDKPTYRVTVQETRPRGALCDSGANGGLAGDDVRILEVDTNTRVDVTGIKNNGPVCK